MSNLESLKMWMTFVMRVMHHNDAQVLANHLWFESARCKPGRCNSKCCDLFVDAMGLSWSCEYGGKAGALEPVIDET